MSDKINNKNSINDKLVSYIEGVSYAIIIMLVIFLNNYGMIYIRMVPLLFLLGLSGNLVFNRPILTSIFGSIVSFCIIYIQGNISLTSNIINSVSVLVLIGMGEILGYFLKLIYFDFKAKIKLSKFKKYIIYFFSILCVIIPIFLNAYINGNFLNLFKSQKVLYSYLNTQYSRNDEFSIVDVKYTFLNNSAYVFSMKNNYDNSQNNIYNFIVYSNNKIEDTYNQKLVEKNNNLIEDKLNEYIEKNNMSKKYDGYNINIEYRDSNVLALMIKKKVDELDDNTVLDFSKNIVNIIADFKDFSEYDNLTQLEVNIGLKDSSNNLQSIVYKSEFNDNYMTIFNSLRQQYLK